MRHIKATALTPLCVIPDAVLRIGGEFQRTPLAWIVESIRN